MRIVDNWHPGYRYTADGRDYEIPEDTDIVYYIICEAETTQPFGMDMDRRIVQINLDSKPCEIAGHFMVSSTYRQFADGIRRMNKMMRRQVPEGYVFTIPTLDDVVRATLNSA